MEPGGDMTRLELEHNILTIVGQRPGIITDKGFTEAGLYLERAANGTILKYLADPNHPSPSLQQRIMWCRQVTEAVQHIHELLSSLCNTSLATLSHGSASFRGTCENICRPPNNVIHMVCQAPNALAYE